MKIKKAVLSDVEVVTSINIQTWKNTYLNIIPKSYLDGISYEQKKLDFISAIKKEIVYLIFFHETPVGMFIIEPTKCTPINNILEIKAIYILNEYQQKGAGKFALRFIIDLAKENDYDTVELWVLEENIKAINFYIKNKFIKTNTSKKLKFDTSNLKAILFFLNVKP